MFKLWVDTKKYRNKITNSFDNIKVFDAFSKKNETLKEFVNADLVWQKVHQKIKDLPYKAEANDVLNILEDVLSEEE